MAYSKINATIATLTRNRTGDDICPFSGMCVTCNEGCTGLCEIGRSAYRGAEVIYPQPFGTITAGSQKEYPIDFSHFSIMGSAVGAYGIPPDSDQAIFPRVDLECRLGQDRGIQLKLPLIIPGLGSTDIARRNWEGIAIGAAISGIPITVGENVCGMDEEATIENDKIVDSPDLKNRVKTYRDWQDKYGIVVIQANVEDGRLGVLGYAITRLGIEAVELKWGQGAKNIGGEVKISSLEKAQLLKKRGYIVLPNPADEEVVSAFRRGLFKEFERHSRIGMVTEEDFIKRVEELRKLGAKYIFLKTGAYRPADLARAIKYSSLARIDVLTVDGAGGGTGMSPWRMMNEWGIPTVEIETLAYRFADRLAQKGEYIPQIVIAGGIVLEDQIFKGLSLGAPYVKAVGMARGPLAAAMVGKTIGQHIQEGTLPSSIEKYGKTAEEIFVTSTELKHRYGRDFDRIPPSAIGVYTYFQRIAQGLRQLMCGARKFKLNYLNRQDIVALTREAAEITGINYVMEADREEVEKILG